MARKTIREEAFKFPVPESVKDAEHTEKAPKKFGDSVTSDNIIVVKNSKSSKIEATSLTVKDRGTGWVMGYPARGHTKTDIVEAIQDFKGPEKVHYWYSDGALELHAACRAEGIRHDVADSDRHESNGVIERCNRTVIEGTKCLLYQSGMPHKYWPQAMQTFCMNYNFTHIDAHKGTVPQVERHGGQFAGTPMVFGQRIRYLPSAKREVDEQKKFDARLRDGIFAGYRMHSGGLWTGQYLVFDAERFQELREDQAHVAYDHGVSEIYIPGTATNDKEERLQFPVASGLWKEAGPTIEPLPPVDPHELWQTTEDEVLPSSQRPASLHQLRTWMAWTRRTRGGTGCSLTVHMQTQT